MNSPFKNRFQARLHEVIFEADTRAGKVFDVALIAAILLSVLVVMLDSEASIRAVAGDALIILEWIFTILFTIEYALRIMASPKPATYIFSFYGIVDLLSILPTYLTFISPSGRYLAAIRVLRVLRIFRILKLVKYLTAAKFLKQALHASRQKIAVFLFTVVVITVIVGSLMYIIEGEEHGFTSIPQSIYWAIVTLTTVGYGDVSPVTPLGKLLATFIMILGYGIIAVPTGIVSVEMAQIQSGNVSTQVCPQCGDENHQAGAVFCYRCGSKL